MNIKYTPPAVSVVNNIGTAISGEIKILGTSIVVKATDGRYAPLKVDEYGTLYVDSSYSAEDLKKKQMLEQPEEFPMAKGLYGD